ncbi:hypothetical protein KKH23_06685 [Patescibacteria group bacterium]|nr:hypothetical protein [Patescibacteria group bacterium]MBU0846862.1 hypothetical protein [Patescibacteria group bacterium]
MDMTTVAIAGVVLIPLIIGLIQFIKRLAPDADGRVWLVLSMILGVAGETVAFIIAGGVPADIKGWAALVVMGLSFGLAASKSYDEAAK